MALTTHPPVHNCRVNAAVAHPAGNPVWARNALVKTEAAPTHFHFDLCLRKLKLLLQTKETKTRAYKLPREYHYTPESFRMECVGKTGCAAAYRVPCLSEFGLLELAKGFEPPTL